MSNYLFKLKTKSGHIVLKPEKPLNTIADLKCELSKTTNIPPSNLYVLHGFPPKKLDLSLDSKTLESSNVHSGDTLIIEERETEELATKQKNTFTGNPLETRPSNVGLDSGNDLKRTPGILIRKVVPADNSCLFTSIGYVIGGHVDVTCGSYMRQIISEEVANNLSEYNEAILGRTNAEYSQWILRPDSWGGAIELAILSKFYGIEIAVVDTVNGIVNRFGEDQQYDHRVFLIFDGIHYDPLYWDSPETEGNINTIFPVSDEVVLRQAEDLALEAKSSRQFTDINKFTLTCQVCKIHLVGQTEAVAHAKETGHTNFGEYTS